MDKKQQQQQRIERARALVRELVKAHDLEGGLEGSDYQLIAVGDSFSRRQMERDIEAANKNLTNASWLKYTNEYQQQIARDRIQCLQMVLDNWEAITTV